MFAPRLLSHATSRCLRGAIRTSQSPILSQLEASTNFVKPSSFNAIRSIRTVRPTPAAATRTPLACNLNPIARRQSPILRQIRRYADEAKANGKVKKPRGRIFKAVIRTLTTLGLIGGVLGGALVCFFIYDATTYKEDPEVVDVPVSELALNPERGGPKNLPIARVLVDDDESEGKGTCKHKPKLVILGCGWGSVAILKTLQADQYHVTVVSPSNYFLFTPFLPSATVGTLELRSLVEPIRTILARIKGHFLQAEAESVDFSEKLVEVSQVIDGEKRHFYLPYDKLIIGVGSKTNTHGVEGLEHCQFLKTIDDARKIRKKAIGNFEKAVLPTTSDEERKRLLSFVICGGGPTGIEFAAEIYDMLNEDLIRHYPRILRNEVSVHVIQSRSHILNTYDEALSMYAEERFARDHVEVYTNARVQEVKQDKIVFSEKTEDGKVVTKEIPYGLCLWSTGVSQTDFAKNLATKLDKQTNKHALETDTHLRLIGAPIGDVYAIGDCSTVQYNLAQNIMTFLREIAWEKGKDPKEVHLTFKDWQTVAQRVKKRFPQAGQHLRRLDKLFQQYDVDKSGTLDFNEFSELLSEIDNNLTSLPATAQRAHQQGQYLARKLNKLAQVAPGMRANGLLDGDLDETYYKAFEYKHLGSLAYVGNAAVFDVQGFNFAGGIAAVYLWRSAYFAQSVSLRTRFLLFMDWAKRALFGRDMMDL
ncbi:hypothetical protein TWF102_000005 [Orbilia oligospora]|uniref:EF-hand domain-containing protein n=1 Tax=Orbilia oligospora TaxID=2813651 RepID=A0A7C8JT38_ORBOL|nr:hypothetical protein TWF103_004059 [Orbilia oligospora]KAF3113341.1 hypothetical protein TWF102_000005 [Orbilia oligospora]KAF3115552.1 hypothetical protein TWF706_005676 [Orbilia oligospora]KAF3134462.1 hypothetical protein TWF594_008703 [Orbilia oligospora]